MPFCQNFPFGTSFVTNNVKQKTKLRKENILWQKLLELTSEPRTPA